MFLGQAGMFLSFQARRSSATRSSTSDLTVYRRVRRHCYLLLRLVWIAELVWIVVCSIKIPHWYDSAFDLRNYQQEAGTAHRAPQACNDKFTRPLRELWASGRHWNCFQTSPCSRFALASTICMHFQTSKPLLGSIDANRPWTAIEPVHIAHLHRSQKEPFSEFPPELQVESGPWCLSLQPPANSPPRIWSNGASARPVFW